MKFKSVLTRLLVLMMLLTISFLTVYLIKMSKTPVRFKELAVRIEKKIDEVEDNIVAMEEKIYGINENMLINSKYEINEFYDTAKMKYFKNNTMKYILIWTHNDTYPFIYLKNGQQAFISEKCEYTNCYVTNDKRYLPSLTDWDAILFHGPEFTWSSSLTVHDIPAKRSPYQKYVFSCIESADNYPSCKPRSNGFFNWTWSYKVDSDVRWGYMGIRDLKTKKIVGPVKNMHWKQDMKDISEDQKKQLSSKSKAAAWFVSNCGTKSKRERFAKELQNSLEKYNLQIDIYGLCGSLKCERDSDECWQKVKNEYYFYLAFENSFSEDYVTEKFVHPMKHWAVPIVWGGSDYSRFAPPGSYIDARAMDSAQDVADKMNYLINNFDEYTKYFRWINYYSYQRDIETPDTQAFCLMCKALNDPIMMSRQKIYKNFNKWWNGDDRC